MATVGAELSTLSTLQSALREAHGAFKQNHTSVTQKLSAAVWDAPYGDQFREAWCEFSQTLTKIEEALSEAFREVGIHHNNIKAATGAQDADLSTSAL